MKYLMLFCGTDEDARASGELSPDQLRERYAQVGRWFAENKGRIGATGQLQGPDTATSVRFGGDGAVVVTDGPFLEGKERRRPRRPGRARRSAGLVPPLSRHPRSAAARTRPDRRGAAGR